MAQDIFRQDMISVYREQTVVRDELKATFRSEMESLMSNAWSMNDKNLLVYMFQQLRKELRQHKGKKVYGYLNAETKKTVNEIVRMIAETPEIAELYDKWYEYKCATVRLYTDAMPEKIPLEENREFKSIRNIVVRAAVSRTTSQRAKAWRSSVPAWPTTSTTGKARTGCSRTRGRRSTWQRS